MDLRCALKLLKPDAEGKEFMERIVTHLCLELSYEKPLLVGLK